MSLRPLSQELQNIAINELNEDPTRIHNDIKLIREWSNEKPHVRIKSDQWILTFLRGCSFDLELAKSKIDLLFTLKPQMPEFFFNRDPFLPEIQQLLKLGLCLPLRKSKDPSAPCIVLHRVVSVDLSQIRIENVIKLGSMILDILQNEDDDVVISGGHLIMDLKGATAQHAMKATPSIIKKVCKCFIDAYAIRTKGCHVINAPQIIHFFYKMLKHLFHSKLIDMVQFYSSSNERDLFETIPLSILPKEYGGDGGTLEELTNEWKEKVESYRDWFLEEECEAAYLEKTNSVDSLNSEIFRRELELD